MLTVVIFQTGDKPGQFLNIYSEVEPGSEINLDTIARELSETFVTITVPGRQLLLWENEFVKRDMAHIHVWMQVLSESE